MSNIRMITAQTRAVVLAAIKLLKNQYPNLKVISNSEIPYDDMALDMRDLPGVSVHQTTPLYVAVVSW